MSVETLSQERVIRYPDSDGQPMADNTVQYRWIELLKGNLEIHFSEQSDVFVAADLLWYPVRNHPEIRTAPDVLVAFGRPKGDRGSYRQWEEEDIAPQVVFEVLSPGNRAGEMTQKGLFYERHGVQEYYIYDPAQFALDILTRQGTFLAPQMVVGQWISPLLNIRFVPHEDADLEIFYPDGRPFVSMSELDRQRQREQQRAEVAEDKAAKLAAKLKALGIDPDGA